MGKMGKKKELKISKTSTQDIKISKKGAAKGTTKGTTKGTPKGTKAEDPEPKSLDQFLETWDDDEEDGDESPPPSDDEEEEGEEGKVGILL